MDMTAVDQVQRHTRAEKASDKTKHPGICLVGFFSFLTGTALLVHFLFQALF